MVNDYSKQFRPILEVALNEARNFQSSVIVSEHFVLAALRDTEGYAFRILRQLQVPVDEMIKEFETYLSESEEPTETTSILEQQYKISMSAIRHLKLATSEARKMNAHLISSEHILLALIHDQRSMDSEFLRNIKEKYLNFDISIQNLSDAASPTAGNKFEDDEDEDEMSPFKGGSEESSQPSSRGRKQGSGKSGTDTPALDKFGYDMTKLAATGKLDPVVGRENEIERLAQILSRRKRIILCLSESLESVNRQSWKDLHSE